MCLCPDKDSYPHDRRADKDSYPHDRHNQYILLRLMSGHFEFFFRLVRKIHYTPKSVYTQHFGYFIFKILNHAQIRIARPWYEIIKNS